MLASASQEAGAVMSQADRSNESNPRVPAGDEGDKALAEFGGVGSAMVGIGAGRDATVIPSLYGFDDKEACVSYCTEDCLDV